MYFVGLLDVYRTCSVICYMCGFNCGYHELNVCYNGKPVVHFNNTQTDQKIAGYKFTDFC